MAGGIIGYKDSNTEDFNNINRGSVTSLAAKGCSGAAGGVVGVMHYTNDSAGSATASFSGQRCHTTSVDIVKILSI